MKTVIAVPCMDMVHTAFFTSYNRMERIGETMLMTAQSSLIYDARNRLARAALETDADRVLWMDSDTVIPPDMMERLSADLDEGRDYVSALMFRRNIPTNPILYSKVEYETKDGQTSLDVAMVRDWPDDRLFEVGGTGFGVVMMTAELLRRVSEAAVLPFSPLPGLGEDIAFCWRARQLGYTLWCDPRVQPGHIGVFTYDGSLYEGRVES